MTAGRAFSMAALFALGWWLTSLRPFSVAATVAVVGAGAAAMAWGATHPRLRIHEASVSGASGTTAAFGRGVARWLVLASILTAWQLAAYLQDPRSEHPTLSSIANSVLAPDVVRAIACAAWLAVAVRLAAR